MTVTNGIIVSVQSLKLSKMVRKSEILHKHFIKIH